MHTQSCLSTEPRVHVLPNGLQVVIQEDGRFPLVAMRLYIHAGSAFERPEEAGVSHLLEHMAFKGGQADAGPSAREVERVGGSVNAATGFDHTMYMLDLPASEWRLGLDILHELCFRIKVDAQELELEKQVVLAELERNRDDPRRCLFESMQAAVWRDTVYERPVIGRKEALDALRPEHIRDYLERLYQPQGMVLVVCGKVRGEEVLARAAELFGAPGRSMPLMQPPGLEQGCSPAGRPRISVEPTHWSKVHLAAGFPLPGLASPWATALEVLTYLLCGDRTSRWYTTFKYESELVDEISVAPVLLERGGMLYVKAQLDADKTEAFWGELLEEISRVEGGSFSDAAIARAKLNIEDALMQTRETLAGVAAKLGFFQFFEGDLRAEERYLHHLRQLTRQEIGEALDRFLAPERMAACLLAPETAGLTAESLENRFQAIVPQDRAEAGETPVGSGSDEVQVLEVRSGCRLVLIPDRTLPYVAVDLSWPGGDLLLGSREQGLASLTARTLLRGTEARDHQQIQEYLAERAASMEAYASRDQFSVTAKCPSRFSRDVLTLLEETVSRPAFRTEELDKTRQDQRALIEERAEHPLGLISREVFPFLYPGQPYGAYHLGLLEELEGFGREALEGFWSRQSEQPWVLSICGDFDPRAMRETAHGLSGLSRVPALSLPREVVWAEDRELRLTLPDRRQSHLLLIFPLPGLEDPASAGLTLLKNLLGGQGGLLFREMRDKQGLGYAVTPMLWRTKSVGFLAFYIGTEPGKGDAALESFHQLVGQLREEAIEPGEVARAQQLLEAEYFRERQSLASRSSEAADLATYGLDLGFYQAMIERAFTLSAADLSALARRYLDLDAAYTITLSPEEEGWSS